MGGHLFFIAFLKRNIDAIRHDPALRYYGVAMAFLHALTAYWFLFSDAQQFLHSTSEPICWPFFHSCDPLRILSGEQLQLIFIAYGAAAVAIMALFMRTRYVNSAYFALIAINIFKLIIVLIDYRLRLNQHYMGFAITIVYLFATNKRTSLTWMIALFYFWAGVLKLNWGWLSGDALLNRLPIFTGAWRIAACAYVIALELVVVWGVFSKRWYLFWPTLLQLIIFHLISFWVVGFYYPLLMFAILSFFVFERAFVDVKPVSITSAPVLLIAIFSALQIIPYTFPGDFRITGEGRLLSLHMFDAPHQCEIHLGLYTKDEQSVAADFRLTSAYRIGCEPAVYFRRAEELCRRGVWQNQSFTDFELLMLEGKYKNTLMHIENFCSQNLEHHFYRHNEWIAIY